MQISVSFQRALGLHRAGQLTQAKSIYEDILRVRPQHFDALHLLGVIAAQQGDPGTAIELIGKAIEIDSTNAAVHVALTNIGSACRQMGRLDAALRRFDEAIVIQPDYLLAFMERGNTLSKLGRWADALASYDRAIAIKPDYADAHFNRGNVLSMLGQLIAALDGYDKGLSIAPQTAVAWSNRGALLNKLKRFDEALVSCDRAIALNANLATAHANRGGALRQLGRAELALSSYDRAIAIDASFAEAHANRGETLKDLRQLSAAVSSFTAAISIRADYAEAYCGRALTSLLSGDFESAWRDYEWRWRSEHGSNRRELRAFDRPLWLGDHSIAGKTILLHGEQGLGDSIQFCRYTKCVAELGATVLVEVQAPLAELLTGLDGAAQVLPRGATLPDFDYHCPLLSLPLAFNTNLQTIPAPVKYLHADPARIAQWRIRLGDDARPRIGLAWSGNPNHPNDRRRSVALQHLLQRLPSEFRYFSLQKDLRDSDKEALQSHPGRLRIFEDLDFPSAAALCECMDLVVSADTSLAHLSGALGKCTWVLLPFHSDWRWLLDRDDSPWYPTATLYRQRNPGDWSGAIERLTADLIERFNPDRRLPSER